MKLDEPKTFAGGKFLVERELGKGGMGVVYAASDQERQMRVALKTLLYLEEDSLYHLKKEFRSLHDLIHPNLCSFMELIKDDSCWFFTMELIDGKRFIEHVKDAGLEKPPESWVVDERKLRGALAGLCEGLYALHSKGKIHRDVKPSNVLVTEEQRVVLLDFGLVTDAGARDQTLTDNFTGTAAYMAPEQADSQRLGPAADWYAVGSMLYQALTGRLPFIGPPMKMILEKQVYDPAMPSSIASGVPEDLERLCMSLLQKNPDQRPSTEAILETLKVSIESSTVVGTADASIMSRHHTPFVGREAELDRLSKEYWRTREGTFRSVLIEGVSGVGKSALIRKLKTRLTNNNPSTLFLSGRCYERESSPFKAFDGIIEDIIRHVERLPSNQKKLLKPRNPALLAKMFPALKRLDIFSRALYLSKDVKDPQELQNRTFDTMKEFFSVISRQGPLVVVIDDVQWIDADSLLLLHRLVGEKITPSFLLILLNRVSPEDKTSATDWSALLWREPTRIKLETLSSQDAESLSCQLIDLHALQNQVDPSAIATEAGGHPLYIAELVHHIAIGTSDWKSLNLDDVIWNRVKTLPLMARRILEIVCVAGMPLTQEYLRSLTDMGGEDYYKNLRLLDSSNLVRSQGPRQHHFIEPYHDRVRESVVAQLSLTGESKKIHLDIGRFFLRTYTDTELKEDIFDVTQHLHTARDLISDEEEQMRLAELYFLAGQSAQESAAYASSLIYFKQSIACFSDDQWNDNYDTMFALYSGAAESAYITGDFSLTADLINEARAKARSALDKARIYETYILSLVADGKPMEAIDAAVGMIRRLNVRVPYRPTKLYVLVNTILSILRLAGKTDNMLLALPKIENPQVVAVRRLMRVIVDQVYVFLPNLWVTFLNKSIPLCLKYGVDRDSALTFGGWGTINCAVLKRYKYGYKYGNVSLLLQERFGESGKNPMAFFVFAAFIQHWRDHLRDTLPVLLHGHRIAFKTGVITYEAYNGSYYCSYSFLAGVNLNKLIRNFAYYGSGIKDKKQDSAYNTNRIFYQTALNLMAPSKEPSKLEGIVYRETEMVPIHLRKEQKLNLYEYYFCSLFLAVFFGRFSDAYGLARESKKYTTNVKGLFASGVFYFFDSLACLNYLSATDPRSRKKHLRQVASNQKKYKKIVANSPLNHLHKYQLVEAERARVAGNIKQPPLLYEAAIQGALSNDFIQDAALASEFAAAYYAEQNRQEQARHHAQKSIEFYGQWGAGAKVEDVQKKYGLE